MSPAHRAGHPIDASEDRMLKKTLTALAACAVVAAGATAAGAITRGGAPDAGEHPYVGLMVAHDEDGDPLWRCSGTLLSSTVYLTAGHCTEAPAASAVIYFDEDVDEVAGYPSDEADATGATFTHPDYDPNAFYMHDAGVVVLDEEVAMDTYGELPEQGVWDELATARGQKDTTVEAVGYGLQRINPQFVEDDKVRLKADLMLVSVRGTAGIPAGTSVTLSGDAARGGTCFGDSGGPLFLGTDSNVIGAVTSFGLNGNCAGIGGGYRIDQPDDLAWIGSFLD